MGLGWGELEARLGVVLPEVYRGRLEEVRPVSMGSAGLKFGVDGRVAWDEIWGSFCDLAMAGGPPHRGRLLMPGSRAEVQAELGRYRQVADEIRRGVGLACGLEAEAAGVVGWVRVQCADAAMAGWLARAALMENVSARCEGTVLYLPAGPGYRLEKETKNVVTVMAKTTHYWLEHMRPAQRVAVGELFARMDLEGALLQPLVEGFDGDFYRLAGLREETAARLGVGGVGYAGWVGVECGEVGVAVWMMRAMVATNVVSRREGTVVYVPVHPEVERVVDAVGVVRGLAKNLTPITMDDTDKGG